MEKLKDLAKTTLINFVFPFLIGFGTFLFTKKKYDTEVIANQLENVKIAIEIYRDLALDIRAENEQLKERIAECEDFIRSTKTIKK